MALFQCHYFSTSLIQHVGVNVILPQAAPTELHSSGWQDPAGTRYPVLYLLHGLSDDHTVWLRRTSIERYVDGLGLAVVMPSVHRSFYQDMRLGTNYWTFVSEELPALVRSTFPISARRQDNFAAGLSMGGYGAMRLGLGKPENFAAVASLSGALDLARYERDARQDKTSMNARETTAIFGDGVEGLAADSNLLTLLESNVANNVELPQIYQACGTEDFLWQDNLRFRDHARTLGVDFTWVEGPGAHNWEYWDEHIQGVLKWLPLPGAGASA